MLLRWANAKEQMKAAHLCCDYQLYDESISLALIQRREDSFKN